MKKIYIKNNFRELNKQIIIVGIIFVISVIMGSYLNQFWTSTGSNVLQDIYPIVDYYNIDNMDMKQMILVNLKSNIVFMMLIFISSLMIVTFPIALIIIILKGLSIGYTINSCILVLKFESIKMLLLLLFKNFILIPGTVILLIISIKYFMNTIRDIRVKRNNNIVFLAKRYTINTTIIIILTTITQSILTLLTTTILQFLMK